MAIVVDCMSQVQFVLAGERNCLTDMSQLLCLEDQHYINNDPGVGPDDKDNFESHGNDPPKHCTYHERMIGISLNHLVKSKGWPYDELRQTLQHTLAALEAFKPIEFDWSLVDCESDMDYNWFRDDYSATITQA